MPDLQPPPPAYLQPPPPTGPEPGLKSPELWITWRDETVKLAFGRITYRLMQECRNSIGATPLQLIQRLMGNDGEVNVDADPAETTFALLWLARRQNGHVEMWSKFAADLTYDDLNELVVAFDNPEPDLPEATRG